MFPQVPREVWLVLSGTLFLLGVAATAERILRARRHGYSVRLQIFVPLAATTLALSASFAAIVIDRMQARAALFARRAAEDEAQVVAALLRRSVQAREGGLQAAAREVASSGVLQAFSRSLPRFHRCGAMTCARRRTSMQFAGVVTMRQSTTSCDTL